ncbi:MAG: helix-turn-helix transcriptional regulator [Labilithrix sp.]|nr:helix-turn-helix transcriptional regulator [Labilithrix sp.]MBX3218355.1 helix-turn-helix transcriptional regulator [Labilithrix sp.]
MPTHLLVGLRRARELVRDDFASDLDVRRLAKAAGLSPFHFVRSFESAYGMTPGRFVQRVRLERARDLLVRGTSVTSACFEVGYASLGSFSATFHRHFAESPRAFAQRVRAIGAVPARLAAVYVPLCFFRRWSPPLV